MRDEKIPDVRSGPCLTPPLLFLVRTLPLLVETVSLTDAHFLAGVAIDRTAAQAVLLTTVLAGP
jgi:hypothetical protein